MTGRSNSQPLSGLWVKASCQVPGSGHLERDVPCQDMAGAWISPRPCLIVLDGRGSASHSHLGAHAAITQLRATIRRWEPELKLLLDQSNHELASVGWKGFAQMLYHIAASEQLKLAGWYERPAADFEFTLTIAIVGKSRIGWMSVGDSPLAVSRHGVVGLVTAMEEVAFANQTTFVSATPKGPLGLRGGVIPAGGVTGLLAMSDGAASRLLQLKQQIPALAVGELMEGIASSKLRPSVIKDMLKDPAWDHVTRDDRSIAMLAMCSTAPSLSRLVRRRSKEMHVAGNSTSVS